MLCHFLHVPRFSGLGKAWSAGPADLERRWASGKVRGRWRRGQGQGLSLCGWGFLVLICTIYPVDRFAPAGCGVILEGRVSPSDLEPSRSRSGRSCNFESSYPWWGVATGVARLQQGDGEIPLRVCRLSLARVMFRRPAPGCQVRLQGSLGEFPMLK